VRRYRIEGRPLSAEAPRPGWWWRVMASDDPLTLGGFDTWANAMRYVDEEVQRDRLEASGVCPFSHLALVECQAGPCDDCGIVRREGPVDDVQPCSHRTIVAGCSGCTVQRDEPEIPDAVLAGLRWPR